MSIQKKRKPHDKCPDCGANPGEACWDDPHPTFVLKDRVGDLQATCCGDGNKYQKAAASTLAEIIFDQAERISKLEEQRAALKAEGKRLRAELTQCKTAAGELAMAAIQTKEGETDDEGQPRREDPRDGGAEEETPGEEPTQAPAQEVGDQARPVTYSGYVDEVDIEAMTAEQIVAMLNARDDGITYTIDPAGRVAMGMPAANVPGGIFHVGEPVKTAAEYSADITDPLETARQELDLIISLDGDKAWDAAGGAAFGSPREERDHYISALETFLAAMLKWAQGREQCRVDAVKLLPGDLAPTMLSMSAALAVMLGHPDINTDPPPADSSPSRGGGFPPFNPNEGD
jgi:hypothetical protein